MLFFLNILGELNWKNGSNFTAIIFKEKKNTWTFMNVFSVYPIMQEIGLSCVSAVVFCRLMKTPVSFLKPLKEVLTTSTQRPTFKQKNLIFKFKKSAASLVPHQNEAPPDGYQVKKQKAPRHTCLFVLMLLKQAMYWSLCSCQTSLSHGL